ncbi:MAG TPA: ATP-binding cassette domain-containing protein [Candidatus Pygmaiobacter gallistercoris]|nr:ATP-binding cassette domain-containing protein [Candidatus Pygmaiobacter gallistercoris]
MATPMLEIKHLKKYFSTPAGQLHAVDDVNLTIEAGQTLGVVGESGCGKSTLGRTVLRLLEPTSGEVLYNGQDITKFNRKQMLAVRQELQMIFQDPYASLNPRLSVAEIIAEPLIVNKKYKNKKEMYNRVGELMETVGLAPRLMNSYPHELDGGRRQRIGVARALATDPKFIVCDEPVSALDVSIQAQILNLLMDLQDQQGLSYMFITHDLSVVKHISSHIAVMYLGQCVEYAETEELFSHPVHPYTQALLAAIPVIDITRRGKRWETLQGEVTSPVDPAPGCRFAPRCKYACEGCREGNMELKEISAGHWVACPYHR